MVENNKLKRGWIQAFFSVQHEKCKVCSHTDMVVFPYPSLNKMFRYSYVYGCKNCGISYLKKSSVDIGEYYSAEYAKSNRRDRNVEPEIYFTSEHEATVSKYFKRVYRHISYIKDIFDKKINNVLDFGSGPGYFLYAIDAINKYAIEPDTLSKKYLDFIGAKLVDLKELDNRCMDIVYASHSLEHLYIEDIKNIMSDFIRVLDDNGIFLAEVPCGNILRHNIYTKHDPHTIFFTMESMEIILKKAGFLSIRFFGPGKKSQTNTIRKDCQYVPSKFLEFDYVGPIVVIASKKHDDNRLKNMVF